MQRHPVELVLDGAHHFRVPVPQGEDPVTAETVDVLVAVDVPDHRALAAPLDLGAIAVTVAGLREAAQVGVPVVDPLRGDGLLLGAGQVALDRQLHDRLFKVSSRCPRTSSMSFLGIDSAGSIRIVLAFRSVPATRTPRRNSPAATE